jgi:MFS family permease
MESHFSKELKTKKAKNYAKILVLVILLTNFFRNLGLSIVEIGLPKFIVDLSGTLTSYGIIIGVFSITQSIFQFPMAAASDKYNRKILVLIGISIYATGTFLCFLAQSIIELIIYRALQGVGAYTTILQAIIGDIYQKEQHGKGMALYSFSITFGYFGGIIIGGYISYYLGFRIIFLISGFFTVLSGFFIVIYLKDPRKIFDLNKKDIDNKMESSPLKLKGVKLSDLKHLFKDSQYNCAVILNCIRWFFFGGIVPYIIWLLQLQYGLNEIESSFFLILVIAIHVGFILYAGNLVNKIGLKRLIISGQFIIISLVLIFLLFNLTGSLFFFFIISIFIGIGFAVYQTAGNTYLLSVIEANRPELKGTGLSINNAIGFLLGAIGPIVLSILGEISLFLPFYFMVIFIFAGMLIGILIIKNPIPC